MKNHSYPNTKKSKKVPNCLGANRVVCGVLSNYCSQSLFILPGGGAAHLYPRHVTCGVRAPSTWVLSRPLMSGFPSFGASALTEAPQNFLFGHCRQVHSGSP